MRQCCFKWIFVHFFIAAFPLLAFATIDTDLVKRAESGDSAAQIDLALAYQKENKLKSTHYWLIKAASQGDTAALVPLGHLFELDEKNRLGALSIAENWYSMAKDEEISEAELGYSRVLEAQFNRRRAKQVSSIVLLDELIDEDIQQSRNRPTNFLKHAQNQIKSDVFIPSLILVTVLFGVLIKRTFFLRRHAKRNRLNDQISAQNKQIKSLQRHLTASHSQLKKNQQIIKKTAQKESVNQNLTIACAVMGFQPNRIPNEKEIKVRYKKLSRIYHPDASGSDEEMKRLNAAVKVIVNYLKQRN